MSHRRYELRLSAGGEGRSGERSKGGRRLALLCALSVLGFVGYWYIRLGFFVTGTAPGAWIAILPTLAGGLVALVGARLGSGAVLVLAFAIGFVPRWMGLYLLLSGWFASWAGLCELMYLVAAGLLLREQAARSGRLPATPS